MLSPSLLRAQARFVVHLSAQLPETRWTFGQTRYNDFGQPRLLTLPEGRRVGERTRTGVQLTLTQGASWKASTRDRMVCRDGSGSERERERERGNILTPSLWLMIRLGSLWKVEKEQWLV